MRAALINTVTNEVENVIELERDAKWQAPAGYKVVFSDACERGQLYIEREFREP